ncbi:MAG: glutamate synthase subunit beta [Candidatus Nitrosoglobus sp.]
MGKPTGFMEIPRREPTNAPVADRIQNFREFVIPLGESELREQGARCMDCGVPFCHPACPVNNIIPDWNDLVYCDDWHQALEILQSTTISQSLPDEAACTLNLIDQPVTIKTIECAIVDKSWEEDWITPQVPAHKTGKRVAIVGSGPAGLACAQQLARAGHQVEVFEKSNRISGLLRYGIPNFKMSKFLIDRRMAQICAEGVEFHPNTHVGVDIPAHQLIAALDAVVLTGGAEHPRVLPIAGYGLHGIHFAMDFLTQQNRRVAGDHLPEQRAINAKGKHVIVLGGGDSGSDCIGTSFRQGALSVVQLNLRKKRASSLPGPTGLISSVLPAPKQKAHRGIGL